jgi:hypothetical protein
MHKMLSSAAAERAATSKQQQEATNNATICFSTWTAGFILMPQDLELQFEACCSDPSSSKAAKVPLGFKKQGFWHLEQLSFPSMVSAKFHGAVFIE